MQFLDGDTEDEGNTQLRAVGARVERARYADLGGLDSHGLNADAFYGPPPEVSLLGQQAMHCWDFCEGWTPERWPVYAALHRVDDWAGLVELMQAIRDKHRELDELERKKEAAK